MNQYAALQSIRTPRALVFRRKTESRGNRLFISGYKDILFTGQAVLKQEETMQRRTIVFLFFFIRIAAEPIGDFAPMLKGNRWVYETASAGFNKPTVTTTTSVQLTDMISSTDTIWYFFRVSLVGESKTDSQTTAVNYGYLDTLYEFSDSIYGLSLQGIQPPFERHAIDSDGVWQDDSLSLREGKYELTRRYLFSMGDPTYGHQIHTYRQDIGLIKVVSASSLHAISSSYTADLVSFSNEPVVAVSGTFRSSPETVRRATTGPVKTLFLPYLTVSQGSSVFDLLGRTGVVRPVVNVERPLRLRKEHE